MGPFSKIIDISDDTSFEDIIKMYKEIQEFGHNHQINQKTAPKKFKNYENIFSYISDHPVNIEFNSQKRNLKDNLSPVVKLQESDILRTIEDTLKEEERKQDEEIEDEVEKEMLKQTNKNKTVLIFHPKSKAEAGKNGVAVSAPVSHAILYPGQKAQILFDPQSVANAGPLGLAHAHSDLLISYVPKNLTLSESEIDSQNVMRILDDKISST